jgi:hypothetical protein
MEEQKEQTTDSGREFQPLQWSELNVGETYWGCYREWLEPASFVVASSLEFVGIADTDGNYITNQGVFFEDSEGRPMIYRSASDAVGAIKQLLDRLVSDEAALAKARGEN